MKRHLAFALFKLAFSALCSSQSLSTQIMPVKGAPFSGEVHGSGVFSDGSASWITPVARSGNGSVYQAIPEIRGEFKGSISLVTIDDVASQCSTTVWTFLSHASQSGGGAQSGKGHGLSISLAPYSTGSGIPTADDIHDRLKHAEQGLVARSGSTKSYGASRTTSLGERSVDGMTLFGVHNETARNAKEYSIVEFWDSDLGFTYSGNEAYPDRRISSSFTMSNLKLAEPDPELFKIQSQYLLPTNVFLNARSLFIGSKLTDFPDLQEQIESVLTASGRLSIVSDVKAADLVVLLSGANAAAGDQERKSPRQVNLRFLRPNGFPLMLVSLDNIDPLYQSVESPLVNTCLANLWNRIATLQIPSASGDEF
jgi:hypothetical protein